MHFLPTFLRVVCQPNRCGGGGGMLSSCRPPEVVLTAWSVDFWRQMGLVCFVRKACSRQLRVLEVWQQDSEGGGWVLGSAQLPNTPLSADECVCAH